MSPDIAVDVLIVGAGFSGLGMAIKLGESGRDSFLVIEKSGEIGGTWWENRYPGCTCDIPSHLYSFSFDLNPAWTRMFAGALEIQQYLKRCAEKYGINGKIRLRTALREARWDAENGVWHSTTSAGLRIDSRVLISGMGALHVPHYAEIDGIERFRGLSFHLATWDSDVDLNGKNIAVIGTGASAIQFVPQIAPKTGRLYVFQRTPPWILPKPDHPIPERWQRRFRRVPGLMRAFRGFIFWGLEIRVLGFLGNLWMRRRGRQMAVDHLAAQVSDPGLRAVLTPAYEFGCKRVLISNDYYPALLKPNVELITEPIAEVRAHSIMTKDGTERPVDVVIHGSGFYVAEMFRGIRIYGREGVEIHDAWREKVSSLLGIATSGFPNFFMLLGPNTGLGHNSVVLMIEAQVRYVLSCLELMRRRKQTVMEVKQSSQQRFFEEMRKRLAGTVWESGGCRSWYQDQRTGKSSVIWPASVVAYQRRTRAASPEDYQFQTAVRG